MNSENSLRSVERNGDDFLEYPCSTLDGRQQECSATFRLSVAQKEKMNRGIIDPTYNSYDRGHMTPASPFRFSEEALAQTFYCPNIAPQDPWTNRCAWYAVEERTEAYLGSKVSPISGYVVTGTCSADSADGDTYYGLKVPKCFWKALCYADPETGATVTVAFVGDNSVIDANNLNAERRERMESTLVPRDLTHIFGLTTATQVRKAFIEGEKVLLEGRGNLQGLPTARSCYGKLTLDNAVKEQWTAFMPKFRRPMWDCSY